MLFNVLNGLFWRELWKFRRKVTPLRGAVWCGFSIQIAVDHYCAEGRDSGGRGPPLSRGPPGGSWQGYDSQPSGLKALLSVSAIRRPRASSRPPYDENSQLLPQPAVSQILAERARFELAIPFWGTHAFQACLFSHSSISPINVPKNRDCKGSKKIRKSHNSGKKLWDFQKRGRTYSLSM